MRWYRPKKASRLYKSRCTSNEKKAVENEWNIQIAICFRTNEWIFIQKTRKWMSLSKSCTYFTSSFRFMYFLRFPSVFSSHFVAYNCHDKRWDCFQLQREHNEKRKISEQIRWKWSETGKLSIASLFFFSFLFCVLDTVCCLLNIFSHKIYKSNCNANGREGKTNQKMNC